MIFSTFFVWNDSIKDHVSLEMMIKVVTTVKLISTLTPVIKIGLSRIEFTLFLQYCLPKCEVLIH